MIYYYEKIGYYYTHNLSKTEQINFKNSNSNFAYGLECGKIINGLSVEDVLKLESRYVIYKKKSLGDWLGAITIIVWIAEFPLRGIGATNLPSDIMTYIEGALLVIRTIINFLCIPYSCGC